MWVDSLERYILCNYGHLLSEQEWHGWIYFIRLEKHKHMLEDAPEEIREQLAEEDRVDRDARKNTASQDPAIGRMLELEPEAFFVSVAYRVLRDHPNEVEQILCRRCRNLCMTPRAKFCMRCGYAWRHGHTEPTA